MASSSTVKEALARVDVGTAIGELPKGVSQTSIQSDFERELARLKLEKYKTTVKQELALDLRENRHAKTAEAAFLDLDRSSFFHRLRVLEIGFALPVATRQQSATWAERWNLQWTPGERDRPGRGGAAGRDRRAGDGVQVQDRSSEKCASIAEAAVLVRDACQCGLMKSMDLARRRLQELAAASSEFAAIAHAAWQLEPGRPLRRRAQVRSRAALAADRRTVRARIARALRRRPSCDNQAAKELLVAIDELNKVGLEFHDRVDEPLWIDNLQKLADADDRNPLLSGYACAILLERGLIANEDLAREVSRRVSPAFRPTSEPAGSRGWRSAIATPCWPGSRCGSSWPSTSRSLDDEQFRRALVFLRRAFGGVQPAREAAHCREPWRMLGPERRFAPAN